MLDRARTYIRETMATVRQCILPYLPNHIMFTRNSRITCFFKRKSFILVSHTNNLLKSPSAIAFKTHSLPPRPSHPSWEQIPWHFLTSLCFRIISCHSAYSWFEFHHFYISLPHPQLFSTADCWICWLLCSTSATWDTSSSSFHVKIH